MMRRLLLALFVAAGASGGSAPVAVAQTAEQPPPEPAPPPPPLPVPPGLQKELVPPPPPGETDVREAPLAETPLTPRQAPAPLLSRYRNDPAFQYDQPRAEQPTLWDRFMAWLGRLFQDLFLTGVGTSGGRLVLILLAVLLLGWGITRLLRADVGPLFSRRDVDGRAESPLLDVEDIAEVDLAALLAESLGQNDFQEAVRYRYLVALQALDAHGAIRWRRDKTNREYVREATASGGDALAEPFGDVTRVFEWVWYGHRPVDRARYDRLAPLFERLDTALADSRRQPAGAV